MAENYHPLADERLVWFDPQGSAERLERMRKAGSGLMHWVVDWDGTVVPGRGTSWHTMASALPNEGKRAHIRLRQRNLPRQRAGQLSGAQEREWSAKAIDLHRKFRVPLQRIASAAEQVPVRDGAPELFGALERAQVPAIVLSAGVLQVIHATARAHGIAPADIIATELLVHPETGLVIGHIEDTIVDSTTKHEMGRPVLEMVSEVFPNVFVIGDQPHDAKMAAGSPEGDMIRMRVDGEHTVGDQGWDDYLAESQEAGFDCVMVGEDLFAAVSIAEWVTTPQQTAQPQPVPVG